MDGLAGGRDPRLREDRATRDPLRLVEGGTGEAEAVTLLLASPMPVICANVSEIKLVKTAICYSASGYCA